MLELLEARGNEHKPYTDYNSDNHKIYNNNFMMTQLTNITFAQPSFQSFSFFFLPYGPIVTFWSIRYLVATTK